MSAMAIADVPRSNVVGAEKVLILDFGSQYAQLIARRVREHNVYSEIVRHNITAERIREINPRGIILSGGPASVYETGAPKCDPEIFRLGNEFRIRDLRSTTRRVELVVGFHRDARRRAGDLPRRRDRRRLGHRVGVQRAAGGRWAVAAGGFRPPGDQRLKLALHSS